MDIHPIKTEADYQAALRRVDTLMQAQLNTPEGDDLDVLTTLISAYEEQHYPIVPPDPVEAVHLEDLARHLTDRRESIHINAVEAMVRIGTPLAAAHLVAQCPGGRVLQRRATPERDERGPRLALLRDPKVHGRRHPRLS